jgi:hypothetical protein
MIKLTKILVKELSNLFVLFLAIGIVACKDAQNQEFNQKQRVSKSILKEYEIKYIEESNGISVYFDSSNTSKRYKLTLNSFNDSTENEKINNTVLQFYIMTDRNDVCVNEDSVYVFRNMVKFEDYNNDKIKDVLVHNYSDARSNRTYYLFLLDTVNDKFIKVKGFEDIKNPTYNEDFMIITSDVISGIPWVGFYVILADTIYNPQIYFYDKTNMESSFNYALEFNRAINELTKRKLIGL